MKNTLEKTVEVTSLNENSKEMFTLDVTAIFDTDLEYPDFCEIEVNGKKIHRSTIKDWFLTDIIDALSEEGWVMDSDYSLREFIEEEWGTKHITESRHYSNGYFSSPVI